MRIVPPDALAVVGWPAARQGGIMRSAGTMSARLPKMLMIGLMPGTWLGTAQDIERGWVMAHRTVRNGEAEITVRLGPGFALADHFELRAGLFFLLGLVPEGMGEAEIEQAWQQAKAKAGIGSQ